MPSAPPRSVPALPTLYALALALRVLNACLTRTSFQPDEYYQTLEVAHRIAFEYGYETWEWRGDGIRSVLYPGLFVPLYWALGKLGLDGGELTILAPKLLQATLAAACDVATYQLAKRLLGNKYAGPALFCSLASFYNAYASTRTFSNSTETALTTLALAIWPWEGIGSSLEVREEVKGHPVEREWSSLAGSLALAAMATVMRPSNVVIWIVLGLHLVAHSPTVLESIRILRVSLAVGITASVACFGLDTLFYGTPTFTPYTFILQNVLHSIALFYGSNPLHFYISSAVPFMTLTMLPFVLHGTLISGAGQLGLARRVVGCTILAYSFLGHKEFRFIHPLLPILHVFAAHSLVSLGSKTTRQSRLSIRRRHAALILVGLLPSLYANLYHSSGVISIMARLRRIPASELQSVAFLMPCHSTPWMSHLHRKDLGGDGSGEGGRAWFLTCEPPILGQDKAKYRDQSDFFYESPTNYLTTRFPPSVDPSFPPSTFTIPSSLSILAHPSGDLGWNHTWPSHFVLFQTLLESSDGAAQKIGDLLESKGYRVEERIWNSHWQDDNRRNGDVVLLRWFAD